MKLDLAQVQELMTQYGPIDVVFFDGEPQGLRDLAWKLQPNTTVTRGAIQTPELYVPGIPLEGPGRPTSPWVRRGNTSPKPSCTRQEAR